MADNDKNDDKKTDDNSSGALDKLKSLFNEVLDEREAKAKTAAEEAEKEKKDPDPKRTEPKSTFWTELFGG